MCLSLHRKTFYGTRNAMPRKTYQLRLSQNIMKFYVPARLRETIPTVQSVLLFEIQRINYGFLTEITILFRNYDFALIPEIGISRVLQCVVTCRGWSLFRKAAPLKIRINQDADFEGLTNRSTRGKFRLPFLRIFMKHM